MLRDGGPASVPFRSSQSPMNLAVVIPMKPLALAKARLRPHLDPDAHQTLVTSMLLHVMSAVQASGVAHHCAVLSADPYLWHLAQARGCGSIPEPKPRGYNQAVQQAQDWAVAQGDDALLILPGDLQWLIPEDVQRLARRAQQQPRAVVIAPDASHTGTNALLLRPPHIIAPQFGPASFLKHQQAARAAGLTPIIVGSPTLARDIDWPGELVRK